MSRLRRGLDHATASLRFAALAPSNKQASGEKNRKEKNGKRKKMEKKKDAQKEPNNLQELSAFSPKVLLRMRKVTPKTKTNHRNDAGRVPLEARGVQMLKKQARTAP